MNIFKIWMRAATPGEQDLLAAQLGTSRNMLYQISGGFKPVSTERGVAIEKLTERMHIASIGRLPRIYRTDMVEACRNCEFARQCLGASADRAEFKVVTADEMSESEGGHLD